MKNLATKIQYTVGWALLFALILLIAFVTIDTRLQVLRMERTRRAAPSAQPAEAPDMSGSARLDALERRMQALESDAVRAINRTDAELDKRVGEAMERQRLLRLQGRDKEDLERAFLLSRDDMQGFVGVEVTGFETDVAAYFDLKNPVGALVIKVVPLSSAQRAGLRRLDVITRIDQTEIEDAFQCRRVIRSLKPGQKAVFEVIRLREGRKTFSVDVAKLEDWIDQVDNPDMLALRLGRLERHMARIEKILRPLLWRSDGREDDELPIQLEDKEDGPHEEDKTGAGEGGPPQDKPADGQVLDEW